MPLIKKPQKNDVLESYSGTIYKLIASAWIHTRYHTPITSGTFLRNLKKDSSLDCYWVISMCLDS